MRQFLDIGTGIPAPGNTHEVAQAIAPEARVVYVDCDPVVLAHARALLTSAAGGTVDYIDADLRNVDTILDRGRQFLDFSRPVAIMLLAVLHVIPDSDHPQAIVSRLLDAVPPGSYLAISFPGADSLGQQTKDAIREIDDRMYAQSVTYRSREQMARFLEGADLVEPGIVPVEDWRPDGTGPVGRSSPMWCAVGRKR
jgi:trans-aconitate methyltransferase